MQSINRRDFIKRIAAGTAALAYLPPSLSANDKPSTPFYSRRKMKRPNILFILADDLGWCDLSAEGSAFYESRNLDRICAEGMRFTQGYATCQVCSPSRASILTGKYTPRHGITDWIGASTGESWLHSSSSSTFIPHSQSFATSLCLQR